VVWRGLPLCSLHTIRDGSRGVCFCLLDSWSQSVDMGYLSFGSSPIAQIRDGHPRSVPTTYSVCSCSDSLISPFPQGLDVLNEQDDSGVQ
jgi:hypothetical protein